MTGKPAPLSFLALKAEARRRGFRVGISESTTGRIVLEKHSKDRTPKRFQDRDSALTWLHTQPQVDLRR